MAIETFERLRSAYGEECSYRTNVFEYIEVSKKGSDSENAKMAGENNVDCIFYAPVIIRRKFVLEKQTVNGKFYKAVIKILIIRVHRVRPEFQESGFRCPLHHNVPALYQSFWP
jgi:disulfide oxidoreductase YuzD